MLKSRFQVSGDKRLSLLLLGAHCDDIEIGCGGTIYKLIDEYEIDKIKWVVFTSDETRKKEAYTSAKEFLESVPDADVIVHEFKDGYLPSVWSEVKEEFEKLKDSFDPDIIFTHYREDLHQDHRTVSGLTWNTFRNHLILEYEIPKYDGDLGNPNVFISLAEHHIERKHEVILNSFESQLSKQWLDRELLRSLMRIRGVECASETNYAEAFYNRKMMLL